VKAVPRVSFSALQHIRVREPFFSLPCSRKRRRNVALVLRSLTPGFGYPSDEMVWLPDPWGPLSAPNALGLRSSEPCSFRVIGKPFRASLSAPALPGKTRMTLPRRFSGLIPPGKPCPSLSRVFSSGRDRCSPELCDLSGSPSIDPRRRTSPSPPSPRVLTSPQPYDKKPNGPQGVAGRQLGCSPHYRAPACLAFRIMNSLPPLEEIHPPRTIFSSRSSPVSCDSGAAPPCGRWPPA
jgi:hypothetical protein